MSPFLFSAKMRKWRLEMVGISRTRSGSGQWILFVNQPLALTTLGVTANQEATRRLGILSRFDVGRIAVISTLIALPQYERTLTMLVEW
jgi:hypothetical protein